jgi:hypothetical protein
MSESSFRNKNCVRPRKGLKDRERRYKVHRKRLVALGLPEEEVAKMDPVKMRQLLRHPAKLAK